jgi:hypothetical protein
LATRANSRQGVTSGKSGYAAEVLGIDSAPGQKLIVFQVEPGSPSEAALALLANLARHDAE